MKRRLGYPALILFINVSNLFSAELPCETSWPWALVGYVADRVWNPTMMVKRIFIVSGIFLMGT